MPAETYQPKPIDTTGVILPPELNGLIERLAENTHDIWAQQRIKDGWTWGTKRDDVARNHPDLVPYSQLPESEKEYDRVVVKGLLKSIFALGYSVRKPGT